MNRQQLIDKVTAEIALEKKISDYEVTTYDVCLRLADMVVKNCAIPDVVDSEAELCGKRGCNRPKMDGNVYCSYHYEVNFG